MTAASLLTALQRERQSSEPVERLHFFRYQIFNLVPGRIYSNFVSILVPYYLQKTSSISVIDKPKSKVQAPNPRRQIQKVKGNLDSGLSLKSSLVGK